MNTNYKTKCEEAQAQSNRNFSRYKHRKNESEKFESLYNKTLEQIKVLETELENKRTQQKPTGTNLPDNRSEIEIMGLTQGFSDNQLKARYRLLTQRYHPDKHPHMSKVFIDESESEFKRIQSAYTILKKGTN